MRNVTIYGMKKKTALFQFLPFKFILEKSIQRCHNVMKFGVVNKSTILNRIVLHTLQRNITHLAVITRKTNIKPGILKGETGKEPKKTGLKIVCVVQRAYFHYNMTN